MRFFRTCKYLMLLIPCLAVPSCREAAEEEEKVEEEEISEDLDNKKEDLDPKEVVVLEVIDHQEKKINK